MLKKRKTLNCTIIKSNIAEAREELEDLEKLVFSGKLSEEELQIRLCHAYHHLNFAWNVRYVTTSQYKHLTPRQFHAWGRYPTRIEEF